MVMDEAAAASHAAYRKVLDIIINFKLKIILLSEMKIEWADIE